MALGCKVSTVSSHRTNYELLVEQGIAAASKAVTIDGEYEAWDSVVAQHIDVLADNWRPSHGLLRLLERAAERRRTKPMNTPRENGGDYRSRPDTPPHPGPAPIRDSA